MIGNRLKKLRGNRTQSEIAELLNISRARYSHYENNLREPDNEMLQKIAEIYDVSVDYLLTGKDDTDENDNSSKTDDAEFEAFANNPELNVFYKELPESDEEAVERLREIWEIIKKDYKK